MPRNYVFTITSLQACLLAAPRTWYPKLAAHQCAEWGVERIDTNTAFFVHPADTVDSPRIVILHQENPPIQMADWANKIALERMHRAAIAASRPPLTLPRDWNVYHFNNLFSFYVSRRGGGALRWTAETRPDGSNDVVFWLLSKNQFVLLEGFATDRDTYYDIIDDWDQAYTEAAARIAARSAGSASLVSPTVALERTFQEVTKGRSYSDWLANLTSEQRNFIDLPPSGPVKLRGPAGTGKTLCLLLKAIHEVKRLRERGNEPRVLFLTHSWAMAQQIDDLLHSIDDDDSTSAITVWPLFDLAQSLLPGRIPAGLRSLGEDSYTGTIEQLKRISQLLNRAIDIEWPAYRERCTDGFVKQVEAGVDTPDRKLFEWDLLNEFACVLGAEGILPGINADHDYITLARSDWMMRLERDEEKKFVLSLYSAYVRGLQGDGLISGDQIINDFFRALETYRWSFERKAEGFDLLFVDELHLFNEQERLVLHYLSRDPDRYPNMFVALDPRQSPQVVFSQVPADAINRHQGTRSTTALGNNVYSLTKIHRFAPEILRLLQHINNSYPALSLGDDWELDLTRASSTRASRSIPMIRRHRTRHEEALGAFRAARDLRSAKRVAIVLVEKSSLECYREVLDETESMPIDILQARDDVVHLQYRSRTTVLAPAEYVAGLQFDVVIVGGLPIDKRSPWRARRLRQMLSGLYLAISRASEDVQIHVSNDAGGIPEILETAIQAGHLRLV
jgi:hypothetical protein